MNRFTKTTLVALAIVAGTTAGALAQQKSIRLDPVSKDLYRLTYLKEGRCQIKVEVVDEKGTKLLTEQIDQRKSFTKPYNFKNLDFGEYSFKVIDAEGEYVTKIKRTDEVYMVAAILKKGSEKAKVIVKGEIMSPVSVNIFDRFGVLLFNDYIDRERGFSKLYDLSQVDAENLKIKVVSENRLLATAEF